VRRSALRILVLGLAVYLLLPRLAGLRDALDTLVRLDWWLLPVLVALEAASLALYAELVRAVFAMEGAAPTRGVVRVTILAGTALGKVLPGGTVAAVPASVGILRRERVDPAISATALLASGVVSSLVLVVLLPVASAAALLVGQGGAIALGIGGVALAVAALAGLAWVGIREPELGRRVGGWLRRLLPGSRLRAWLHLDEVAAGAERAVGALHAVAGDLRGMAKASGLAAASWSCDFAVMASVAVVATRGAPLAGIALAYIVGQLAAAVPLTPGGVGVVEATMIGALAAQGVPPGQAAVVVLAWRLVSHWLPIVTGLVIYAGVHRTPDSGEGP
jgi:uncharacterized protein (TIRG00374 family)